ncbi:Acyl-protein thioesterase 1 [Vanrija pseudolonga]|uniref:Acyl-protein thioesterase 1 n=1 Tax=Vanrija pseudolonga TaxID=143232 RepID=A0AAF0YJY1_9TREE|nr:Acyl-protein thioesterase 1 [Vanrija pseudolonga]
MASLKHLKVVPKEAHQATVIFLHGLGDSGHGWLPVAKMLWASMPNVKWVLPHAPELPVTLNGGYRMPAWFDIYTLDRSQTPRHEDEAGLLAAVEAVDKLIQAEVDAGIPEDKIVLGGFSQGGAVTALSLLLGKRKLAGYVSLSTWVPLAHKVEALARKDANEIPVFWGHGKDDQVVEYQWGVKSVELLEQLGFKRLPAGETFARPGLRFESYPNMGHSSSPKEIEDLREWITAALK